MRDWGRFALALATTLTAVVGAAGPARAVEGSWAALGSGILGTVRAVAVASNGDIYAGGSFARAGGITVANIAKWDGTSWSPLGSGINGTVYALATDASGNVYAGGSFTQAGGVSTSNIAMWNGSSWSALGLGTEGVDSSVLSLAIDTSAGRVYVGGLFTSAAGLPANHIAAWDGSSWSALGTGLNARATAITIGAGGDVFAGGWFTSAGSTSAAYVARWNGSTWSALGAGLGFYAQGLAYADGTLYVVGDFTTAGGSPASRVAAWADGAWSAMGAGFSSDVSEVAIGSDGSIYVAGEVAGGVTRWSGSTWEVVDGGLNNEVQSLALSPSGAVIVGGTFTTAGGVPSSRIAIWTPAGPPVPGAVTADFTYLMPDGGECTAVSPAKVTVGTSVVLPTFVPCQGSSELVGWRIPGQDWAFTPGRSVGVVDSQNFTAVIREPEIVVEIDANVGALDRCLASGVDVERLEGRTQRASVRRAALADARFAAQAPCTPPGMRLVGWSDRPTTSGSDRVGPGGTAYAPGAAVPTAWAGGGTDPVNRIRLYAIWGSA